MHYVALTWLADVDKSQIWAVRSGSDGPDRIVPIRPRPSNLSRRDLIGRRWGLGPYRGGAVVTGDDDDGGAALAWTNPTLRWSSLLRELTPEFSAARRRLQRRWRLAEYPLAAWTRRRRSTGRRRPSARAPLSISCKKRAGKESGGCARSRGIRGDQRGAEKPSLLPAIERMAAADTVDSGEPVRRPCGVIYLGFEGEKTAGTWGFIRTHLRQQIPHVSLGFWIESEKKISGDFPGRRLETMTSVMTSSNNSFSVLFV